MKFLILTLLALGTVAPAAEITSEKLSGQVVTVKRTVKFPEAGCNPRHDEEGTDGVRSYKCENMLDNAYTEPYKLSSAESYLNSLKLGGLIKQVEVADPKGGTPAYVDFGADEFRSVIRASIHKKFGMTVQETIQAAIRQLPNQEIEITVLRIQPL